MDYLWTPWRYKYLSESAGKKTKCIFCAALAAKNDAEALIVHRAAKNFIILNRYPYTSGHVMVVPYEHVAELAKCDAETLNEMMALAKRVESAVRKSYKPASTHAHPAALVRRHKFHDHRRRDARASGRFADNLRTSAQSAQLRGARPEFV